MNDKLNTEVLEVAPVGAGALSEADVFRIADEIGLSYRTGKGIKLFAAAIERHLRTALAERGTVGEPVAWLYATGEDVGPAYMPIAGDAHDAIKDLLQPFPVYRHSAPVGDGGLPVQASIDTDVFRHKAELIIGPDGDVEFDNRYWNDFVAYIDAQRAHAAPQVAAARDVLAERQRQKDAEGWTAEHDDKYQSGELGLAAACYALTLDGDRPTPDMWPWPDDWWKPTNERRNLVKAGALVLAEIERLDRASDKASRHAASEAWLK